MQVKNVEQMNREKNRDEQEILNEEVNTFRPGKGGKEDISHFCIFSLFSYNEKHLCSR